LITAKIYWLQQKLGLNVHDTSCDFLSFCIFDILITAIYQLGSNIYQLWFPFILYLWYIDYSQLNYTYGNSNSCDFLSFCIFDILITAAITPRTPIIQLWFPFILYLWYIDYSLYGKFEWLDSVVISFHFVSLIYWLQPYLR